MSNFPNNLDDDVSLPRVDDNITEIGGDAINALRDAVFNLEQEIGVIADGYSAKGSRPSLAVRLGISLAPDGTIKSSAISSLGLVSLPITNSQISSTASISESKLDLDYSTSSLFNYITNTNLNTNIALSYINNTGVKLEPHLVGNTYRHTMSQIDVGAAGSFFKNKKGLFRDNTNLYTVFNDLNSDYTSHQNSDGTTVGTVPPDNYAHNASGINLSTNNFSFIPQTATDLQQFAQFIDNSNIFILGTRIQTLYGNGVSRTSRSTSITNSDVGQIIIPYTSAITYLLDGGSSTPVDNIDTSDDIISLTPSIGLTDNTFDAAFAQIKVGDTATVNYGNVVVNFLIKEKKLVVSGANKTFIIRINGKNLFATTTALVRISHALFNTNKQGVMSLAIAPLPATINGAYPSLTVGNPRGAEVNSIGFNPDLLDSTHYNLYLQFYPTGNPSDQVISLPPIDVTGNLGVTPGAYTLDTVVAAMNTGFRAPGYNYRFIAYSYKGELGLMLADAIGNASFSIVSAVVNISGVYDQGLTNASYSNNAVNVFDGKDALGFGPSNAGVASPPYSISYASTLAAEIPTIIFTPLTKKTYYVNGVERERFGFEPEQLTDTYGDGYWDATIITKTIIAGTRVKVTYQVNKDLTTSGLKIGKTLIVQQGTGGTVVDFGRFVIEDIQFNSCLCDGYTEFATITVYDAIHSTGNTPYVSSNVGTSVRLYFSADSIGFSGQNASDSAAFTNFKRSFEIYVNQDGKTFSHERARMNISGSTQIINSIPLYTSSELAFANIYKVSPKLRGYSFTSVKKITLTLTSFNTNTGIFSGYLCLWNGAAESNAGPVTVGKKGNIVRFYDETNVDYIDIVFNANDAVPSISSTKRIDIQLFNSLSLDDEVMLLGNCQVNDNTKTISYLTDERQFGNTSERQLTSSALDYIAAPTRALSENGIIRGFDIISIPTGFPPFPNVVSVKGGVAIVNGKIIQINNQSIGIPVIEETLYPAFNFDINTVTWFLCVNDKAELEFIANTDYDVAGMEQFYSPVGLDHSRIFYAKNLNLATPSVYPIRASYLNEIISNNKDVTPIALIKVSIVPSSGVYVISTASYTDARRFISNGYGGLGHPFILGSYGNFRNVNSLATWLDQLNNYKSFNVNQYNSIGSIVSVSDTFELGGSSLSFNGKVKYIGNGGKLTVASGATIGNAELENLNIVITGGSPSITIKGQVIMKGCTISYTGATNSGLNLIEVSSGGRLVMTQCNLKRNGTTINSYVYCSSSLPQIITQNMFDSTTVNGADTVIVKGLPGGDVYTNNLTS